MSLGNIGVQNPCFSATAQLLAGAGYINPIIYIALADRKRSQQKFRREKSAAQIEWPVWSEH
jgi:hypothetical protein